MNLHRKAIRGLATLAGQYGDRWPELSELEPEGICDFLSAESWTWNPHVGLMGRWEKNHNCQEEDQVDSDNYVDK